MITVCDIIEDLCCNRFFLKTRKFSNGYVKYSHFVCVCVCVCVCSQQISSEDMWLFSLLGWCLFRRLNSVDCDVNQQGDNLKY